MKKKNIKIATQNKQQKMCNGNGWKIWNKSLNYLPQFIIFISLSNLMVEALLISEHNDIDDSLVSAEQNYTHRKGRCKSGKSEHFFLCFTI